ncbi:hypothetical protein [Natronorubrum texcoconense]|uniref:Uncharacterized protein n=1 Tax=Natronorubrum texcoconense TaxID=1095776 RepID=A0A1G9H8M2_9EURY|nr:hypothetical protein [Natronorubrum texcoconense]SDL08763.1 hypothetical protein SAMN04515672_0130 [Natronorubrum texcoconense]
MQRREFLTSGAAASTVAFWGPFSRNDGEDDGLEYDDGGYPIPPDHITEIRDDLDELREFQPEFYYGHMNYLEQEEARSKARGLYGWTAESEDHDVTAHYYWFRHQTQQSLLNTLFNVDVSWGDAHYLDHEPTIVFRREDKTVDTIVTTGGHHYALYIDGEWGPMSEEYVSGRETHVNLMVIRPHNHYMESPSSAVGDGQFVEDFRGTFGSFRDVREDWYDEGIDDGRYNNTADRAIEDPFVFYDEERHHWWDSDTNDAWFARNVWIPLGLSEGTSRNRLRFEED